MLAPGEMQVASEVFDGRNEIWLHQENHETIQAALLAIKKWLKSAEDKVYFFTNSRYLIPPGLLSLAIVVAYLLSRSGFQIILGLFQSFWLTFWTIGVAALVWTVAKGWRGVLRGHSVSAGNVGKSLLLTVFAIPFVGGN